MSKGSAPSPVPGSESAGGEMMRRTLSKDAGEDCSFVMEWLVSKLMVFLVPRVASALSSRKDSPIPRDASIPGTPGRAMGRFPLYSQVHSHLD